eukprot:TRINITY_DN40458_c0_g1_i1.p1 TRINITY_DN40458_c0_g1~~TRINITY_DN40458_c0_g1_i1.p1  ORF type:complete len:384 (+),score=69.77 TRINITY_DN40458_c0_g1_i1:171-1322(+)
MGAAGLAGSVCTCHDCGSDCQPVGVISDMPNRCSYLRGGRDVPNFTKSAMFPSRPETEDQAWQEEEVSEDAASWLPPKHREISVSALPQQSLVGNHKVPLLPEIFTMYDAPTAKMSAPSTSMSKVFVAAAMAEAAAAAEAVGKSFPSRDACYKHLSFDLDLNQPLGVDLQAVEDDILRSNTGELDRPSTGGALVVAAIADGSPLAAHATTEANRSGLVEGDAVIEIDGGGRDDTAELQRRLRDAEYFGGQLRLLVRSRVPVIEVHLEDSGSARTVGLTAERVSGPRDGDPTRVQITAIAKTGLLSDWNAKHGLRRVCVGDFIALVNGMPASPTRVAEALRRFESYDCEDNCGASMSLQRRRLTLCIVVQRGCAPHQWPLASAA